MPNDVVLQVTKWLKEKSGYPLEMRTASALGSAGFAVVQGDYFPDEKTGTLRELDVTGYVTRSESGLQVSIALLIECKSSMEKPWLLFTSSAQPYPPNLAVVRRSTTERGHRILQQLQFDAVVQNSPLFELPRDSGYSLAMAMREPGAKDVTYDALTSVCAATLGHLRRLDEVQVVAFDWPVIVISAPLLECTLDSANDVVVREIKRGVLIWRNPMLNRHTIVNIYTESAFNAEVAALHKAATEFADLALAKAIRGTF